MITVLAFAFGLVLIAAGLPHLLRPRAMARWNDLKAREWLHSKRSDPSRPWQMVMGGLAFLIAGGFLILVGLSRVGLNPLHLT